MEQGTPQNPAAARAAQLELFLLNLRYREGQLIEAEGNRPLLLDDPAAAWVVYTGAVDLFAVGLEAGELGAERRHLLRAGAGQLLLGVAPAEGTALLARGTSGARLLRLPQARLWELAGELEQGELVAELCAGWLLALGEGLGQGLAPREALAIEAGAAALAAGQPALPGRGLLWARPIGGALLLFGRPELRWEPADGPLPMARSLWAVAAADLRLRAETTAELLAAGDPAPALARVHGLILAALGQEREAEREAERGRWAERAEHERRAMAGALSALAQVASPAGAPPAVAPAAPAALLAACRSAGAAQGIVFADPPPGAAGQPLGELLKTLARVSRVRMRGVGLRGRWWRADHGPLLGFLGAGERPVALLPGRGGYLIDDPAAAGGPAPLRPEQAADLLPLAYAFYRPFPEASLSGWGLLRFGLRGSERDLLLLVAVGCLIGLLGLAPPIIAGQIISRVVPAADQGQLLQLGLALLLVALSSGLLQIARGLSLLRVQTRLDASLQAAIWDRLLSLPVPFFRDYTAGALGNRAMGVSEIRRALSGHVVSTVLNSVFSIFSLALLFYYSPPLALVAVGLVALSFGGTVAIGVAYVRNQRALQELQSEVGGLVLQLLRGVTKIRVAGAERHAFAQWAGRFARQKRLHLKGRGITNVLLAYNAAYPVLVLMVLFSLSAASGPFALATGDFVAFQLALAQFLGAWLLLGGALIYILPLIPTYERLRPILDARPEADSLKLAPGELSGRIEVSRLSFRYGPQAPPALSEISLELRPGEFVALVGASGSGKSSLLRLLLGFERPETGAIYYDDHDLAELDLRALRPQVGVVLQSAGLMAGDIYSNIVGSSPSLTIDDAWEAARMVGLADEIRALPMGMHTVISEGGGNFSGGQRQRLLIARAIVGRPRLLFFDEATSALDNRAQEVVSRSIEGLQATRLVIAHRLSTIMRADRIYVFEKGRIAQVGSYAELLSAPGPFAELARRQLI